MFLLDSYCTRDVSLVKRPEVRSGTNPAEVRPEQSRSRPWSRASWPSQGLTAEAAASGCEGSDARGRGNQARHHCGRVASPPSAGARCDRLGSVEATSHLLHTQGRQIGPGRVLRLLPVGTPSRNPVSGGSTEHQHAAGNRPRLFSFRNYLKIPLKAFFCLFSGEW